MKTENLFTPNSIRTNSGIYFDFVNPTTDMICIEDIAHALSMIPRFGGHLSEPYSVAQHCCMTIWMVEGGFHLEALLHDAAEAYIGDMVAPLKQFMFEFQSLETKIESLIHYKFGTSYLYEPKIKQAVKDADMKMLSWEWEALMLGNKEVNNIPVWTQSVAKKAFLDNFYQLAPQFKKP